MKKISVALALLLVAALVFGGVMLSQKNGLQTQLNSAKDEVKAVSDKLTQAQADLEGKAKELTDSTAALDAAKAELETVKTDMETKLGEVAADAKAQIEAKVAEMTESANAQLETIKAQVTEEANAQLEAVKGEYETKVADLEKNVASLTQQVADAGEQIKVLAGNYAGKTVILHSNDVHGAIQGYAYMPTLRRAFEAAGAKVIIADAGDFSQGDIYVSVNKGAAAIELMNVAGYDVVTLGNHELDFGFAQLMDNLSKAQFQTVCSNIIYVENKQAVLPGHTIIESDGVKIGFFGLETPETATKVNPGLITEIDFTFFDDLYTNAQAEVDALKAEGADLIIGIWHLGVDEESKSNGYRSIDVLEHVNGVDFVIDGHSHTVMTQGENGEPIQSTGTKFANIGMIVIDNATKTIESNRLIPAAGLPKDEATAQKAQEIMDEIDKTYNTPFATSAVSFNGDKAPGNRTEETNLGDLITDAMVWSVVDAGSVSEDELKNVVGITNGGGIRAPIAAGDVTMKNVNTVLPFGNTVAVIRVTGTELLEALEASTFCTPSSVGGFPQTSGIVWTLDTTKAYDQGDLYVLNGKESTYYAPKSIQRVTIQSINGEPFDAEKTYIVVTNNFCAAGGDTYNAFFRAYSEGNGFDTAIPLDEALVSYIQEQLNSNIEAEPLGGRLTIIQ